MRAEALRDWAASRGYRVAWGPWHAVEEARLDLARLVRRGEVAPGFAQDYLGFMDEVAPPPGMPVPWVVLVLVPAPAHVVTFHAAGKAMKVLIPPTYVRFRATAQQVRDDLAASVFGGAQPEPLVAPLKAVAARLGLVQYGRNNVSYAGGLGSAFEIVGCVVGQDLSEGATRPRAPGHPEICDSCRACVKACPTGAVPDDRFLLRVERCIVYYNERTKDLPAWIPGRAHRCLIGCMACQAPCPLNAGRMRTVDTGVSFSEEETARILDPSVCDGDPLLQAAARKIAAIGLTEAPPILWRNFRLLAAARGRGGHRLQPGATPS